jgi:hypothetical protein
MFYKIKFFQPQSKGYRNNDFYEQSNKNKQNLVLTEFKGTWNMIFLERLVFYTYF